MRAPLTWLRDHCDPGLDTAGIADRLTMTGTKVEAVHHHGVGAVDRFLVGRVLEVQPHRDADRLKVCKVDLGAGDPAQAATIVCGAPNVAAGQTVAVARPGALMPDGTELKAANLRGIVSEGMILAESELGLSFDGAGILVLDDMALDAGPHRSAALPRPGTPLADLLPIATDVLELEVTPNRPDCLGVYGVARELHAATGAPRTRRRAGADARRPDARAGRRHRRDRGRRGTHLDRRPDGRRPLGGAARHAARAARGCDLGRAEHPLLLLALGSAQRGLVTLR